MTFDEIMERVDAACTKQPTHPDTCRVIIVAEDPKEQSRLVGDFSRWSKSGDWAFRAPHHSASQKGLASEFDKAQGGVMVLDEVHSFPVRHLEHLKLLGDKLVTVGPLLVGLTFSTDAPSGQLRGKFATLVQERADALGADVIFVGYDGPVQAPSRRVSAVDLELVNSYRTSRGMPTLGPDWQGWEIEQMAEQIRTRGRLLNPAQLKRRLLK